MTRAQAKPRSAVPPGTAYDRTRRAQENHEIKLGLREPGNLTPYSTTLIKNAPKPRVRSPRVRHRRIHEGFTWGRSRAVCVENTTLPGHWLYLYQQGRAFRWYTSDDPTQHWKRRTYPSLIAAVRDLDPEGWRDASW